MGWAFFRRDSLASFTSRWNLGKWFGIGVFLLGGSFARADTTATALPTIIEPSSSEAEQKHFDSALTKTLGDQQIKVSAPSDRDMILKEEARLQSCRTPACLERIGRLLDSRFVVSVVAKAKRPPGPVAPKSEPADWEFQLEWFHADIGATGATQRATCNRCDTNAAGKMLSDLLSKAVVEEAARSRGKLDVTSKPPGAFVFVDGVELGVTPFRRTTYSGKHLLSLRSAGFRSEQREIEVPESQRLSLEFVLTAGEDPPPLSAEAKVPLYKKWWFWAAVGGAVAAGAVVTGVVIGTQKPTPNGTPGTYHFAF